MKIRRSERGFALPTIVLASVILMMVLAGALSIGASNNVVLREQYNNQLMREASEAGLQYATACYYQVVTTATAAQWPNAGTLDTGDDCYGTPMAGTNCGTLNATSACYVMSNSTTHTRFSVSYVPDATSATAVSFSAVGYVDKIRTSDGTAYSTLQTNVSKNFSIDFYGLASGNDTTCSILGGKLYCWGLNDSGQVGIGTTNSKTGTPSGVLTPKLINGFGALNSTWNVVAVATGISHTCAIASTTASILDTRQMLCWGDNSLGQYGISLSNKTTPYLVNTISTSNYAIDISGRDHNCMIVVSSTDSTYRRHFCWGNNGNYQAGEKDDGTHPNPKMISGWLPTRDVGATTLTEVQQINSVSGGDSCGINDSINRYVFCMGNADHGMLGDNTTSDSDRAHFPEITSTSTRLGKSLKVVENNGRACALSQYNTDGATTYDSNYHVWCWGSNWDYSTPELDWRIDSGTAFYSVKDRLRAKRVHTDLTSGTRTCVYDASLDSYDCTTIAAAGHTATNLYNANISDIAITDYNMCLLVSGIVYCSGYNDAGQLGQGGAVSSINSSNAEAACSTMAACPLQKADNALPVFGALKGKTVAEITAGNSHFCAITTDHFVYCWGNNKYGQLGDGTNTVRTSPVRAGTPVDILF